MSYALRLKTSLKQAKVRAFVSSHGVELPNGQVFITKPMFVYKSVHTYSGLDALRRYRPKLGELIADGGKSFKTSNVFSNINCVDLLNDTFKSGDITPIRVKAIANLVIPPGALVNVGGITFVGKRHIVKCRSSLALCHSVATLDKGTERLFGVSQHDHKTLYIPLSKMGLSGRDLTRIYLADNSYIEGPNLILKASKPSLDTNLVNAGGYMSFLDSEHPSVLSPKTAFTPNGAECASGIHFFTDLASAKAY